MLEPKKKRYVEFTNRIFSEKWFVKNFNFVNNKSLIILIILDEMDNGNKWGTK